jgi:putative N6-adenine-specific DNA methylase
MDWPQFNEQRWQVIKGHFPVRALDSLPPIQASDRDAGAIKIAQANAERAGVKDLIEFSQRAVSAVEPPPGPGWVVTNPPYGARISANKDLRNLYAQLGNVLRARCPGWQVAILSGDLILLGQTGIRLDHSLTLLNGGIPVRLGRGIVE